MKFFINRFKSKCFVLFSLILLATGIAGCSSGGSSTASLPGSDGEIVVSLTDAPGDFVSYTVDVLSLNLTKANGAEVAALPLSTRVDFAQYTDMTEFLTAATVPSGTYVAATMTLDFRNADIWVENDSGEEVPVANIVDENGDAVQTLEVTVRLEDRNSLTILPGTPAHLMLDFDLQASNQVDFGDSAGPVLTVDPFLIADVDRADTDKLHRIRGLLNGVDQADSSFSVILRPFYCALSDKHELYGIRSVLTDSDTVYHIDGQAYVGSDGLAALSGLDALTPVAALGALKFHPLRFEAWEVYAGTSVPGASLDAVSGWVTGRTGDTLTVRGASLIRSGSSFVFNDEVTVQIADTTAVTRQISSALYSKDDISIGQHITAFGTLTNPDPSNLQMDATQGMVRMLMTTIRGIVVSVDEAAPESQLTLNLQSIGKFRVGNFDFTGTGAGEATDADPENYEIAAGTMDLTGISSGAAVKLKGFVNAFGMAPPDFSAVTLIDVTDLRAYLRINWMPATATPFTLLSADGLELNLEGSGMMHYLVRGCVVTDLYDLEAAPVVAPAGGGQGLYVLHYDRITETYSSFDSYVQRIEALLEDGYMARKAGASGRFDDAASTLAADIVEIQFGTAM